MGCVTELKRWLFFFFNFVFFCLGIAVLVVGVMSRVKTDKWDDVISLKTFFEVGNLFIAAGCIVTMIALLGFLGALKKWKSLLVLYAVLVLVIFGIEVYAGGDAFLNRGKVKTALSKGLDIAVNETYSRSDPASTLITKAVDWMQGNLKCCGATGPEDWKVSHWYKEASLNAAGINSTVKDTPRSCCKFSKETCSLKGLDVYNKGCVAAGEELSMNHLWTLGTVALVIAFVEVTGIVLAINLVCAFRNEEVQKPKSTV